MKQKNKINIFTILKIVFINIIKACPVYFVLYCLSDILQGLSYGINTSLMQRFFDSLSHAVQDNGSNSQVFLYAGVTSFVIISSQILNGIANFMYSNMTKKLTGHMNFVVNNKLTKISALSYEDPEQLDTINKAYEGSKKCIDLAFLLISMFMFHIPYLIYMILYLTSIQPLLCIALLIIFIPMVISQIVKRNIFSKAEDKAAPLRRRFDEYWQCICGKAYFKETRALGIFQFIKERVIDSMDKLNKCTWKAECKSGLIEFSTRIITLFGYLLILILLVIFSIQGSISVGEFAAIFSSIGLVFGIMQGIIDRNLGFASKNIGYAKNFVDFLHLPEMLEKHDYSTNSTKNIDLKNVYFQYPQANTYALKNITLSLKEKETLAIVGENGSGKTTLAKLLLGLYPPTKGDLFVMGCNVKEALPFRKVSAVFQKFNKYQLSFYDNVTISDPDSEQNNIDDIIYKTNLDINSSSFPDGTNTILSTEFDGVELSGGQWQKVAIARGLYRQHEIIVLDEPTAAIDPIEERALYQKFAEISREKTAIIITHRIGSARIADRIAVMDEGEIVELGTHDELLKINGKYATMFHSQASWYIDK